MENEDDSRYWIENILLGFFLTLICLLGIVGNIITFIVLWFQHQRKRRVILNYFLLGLSVFDTLFLAYWVSLSIKYTHRLFGEPIPSKTYSSSFAAYLSLIVKPSGYIGQTGSIIFIVAITVDRYLTVCHNRVAKIYWKKRILVCTTVSLVLTAVSLAYAIPAWLSYDVKIAVNETSSYVLKRNEFGEASTVKAYNNWLNTVVTMIIPLPILAVLNSLIFQNVHRSLKERITLTDSQVSEISLARMLLCVVFIFAICNTPVVFKLIVSQFASKGDMVRPSDAGNLEEHYPYTVLRLLHWILIGVNSAVNFLIYCTMSQSFRKSLKKLTNQLWKKCRRLIRSEGTVTTSQDRSAPAGGPSVRAFSECYSETEAPTRRV